MLEIPVPQLSAMEQYLFIDNRPSHPLDFFFRVKFDGELNESRIIRAFYKALNHHPLLCAIVSIRRRTYVWEPCERPPQYDVSRTDTNELAGHPSAIDITKAPGTKLHVVFSAGSTMLLFQFHHSATDGLGALGFVTDVMTCYVSDAVLQPSARGVDVLAKRHECGYPPASLFQMIRKQLYAAYLSKEFIGARISPLFTHQPLVNKPRTNIDAYRDIHHVLTVEQTTAIHRIAQENNVTANTWFIRDAFVALDKMRRESDGYNEDDYIRIAVPGSLRPNRNNDGIPAANFFSMTFPARNSRQIADAVTLLKTVQDEVREARRSYYFATFILGLKLLRKIPGGLKRMLYANKCQASLLLTNVGTAFPDLQQAHGGAEIELSGVKLRSVELVPPMRPYQSIAFATLVYAGRQTITMSYDPRIHHDDDAEGILKTYVEQLTSCC